MIYAYSKKCGQCSDHDSTQKKLLTKFCESNFEDLRNILSQWNIKSLFRGIPTSCLWAMTHSTSLRWVPVSFGLWNNNIYILLCLITFRGRELNSFQSNAPYSVWSNQIETVRKRTFFISLQLQINTLIQVLSKK